jgi:hypothetical protein
VEHRNDRSVTRGVQELVRVPARCERAGFCLTVSNHAGDEQVGVVEGGAERVRERVSELAPLVDRPGRLRSYMAGNPSRKRELAEELAEPVLVPTDMGVDLAVRALEVCVCHDRGTSVSRTGDIDRIQVASANCAIQVDVDEVQARRRPEVAE